MFRIWGLADVNMTCRIDQSSASFGSNIDTHRRKGNEYESNWAIPQE